MALLEAPVRQLGEVPGGRGALEAVAQAQPGVADADLGHDVEGAAAGEHDVQLRERLEAAAEARRRPPDALGDRLELAVLGGDQRQDAVRLAEVEPRQDDGIGDVAAGDGHRLDGSTGPGSTTGSGASRASRTASSMPPSNASPCPGRTQRAREPLEPGERRARELRVRAERRDPRPAGAVVTA